MRRRRERQDRRDERRRGGSLAWDVAPLMVLASAGVALLQEPGRQKGRRRERGRGRFANSPREIPKAGWKDILIRAKNEFQNDNIPMIAAGVTFYTLLALFPGIAAFVALYGLFADVATAQQQLQTLSFLLTPEMLKFVGDQMIRVAAGDTGGQSLAFVASLLLSLWSANGAVKAMMSGLTIAYDETETRGFIKKSLTSLGFTVGFLVFVIMAIGLLAAPPALATFVGERAAMIFSWISWPAVLVGLTVGLALLYRYGPSRDPVRWRWISWGSGGVVVLWLAMSALFSAYVNNFGNFDKTYGSLGAVIGFMMWMYLSALVVLAGAELNSEIEHQTARDTTIGAPRPMGMRRATMADTLGAAQTK